MTSCGAQRAVASDLDRERGPWEGDDDLYELPRRPRSRGGASARQQGERGGEGDPEREQRATQEAAWYVRFRASGPRATRLDWCSARMWRNW